MVSIRNLNKRISKAESVLNENPGKSIDDLLAAKKINQDQKAQILKIPSLKASVVQYEEQIAQYKKFDQEYKAKAQVEKAEFEKVLNERSAKELEEAVAKAKAEAAALTTQNQQKDLLLISQFLRLAAIRRADEEADANQDENKALEGVLARVYTGDENAVTTMLKLIQGSEEETVSVTGDVLTTTYAQIKALSLAQAPPVYEGAVEISEDVPVAEEPYPVETDPTVANAGLTEIEILPSSTINGSHEPSAVQSPVPQNSGFGDGANAAAEANWDNNNDLSASQEGWVEVPRDAAETETGVNATPAGPGNTQSWADDQPEHPTQHQPLTRMMAFTRFKDLAAVGIVERDNSVAAVVDVVETDIEVVEDIEVTETVIGAAAVVEDLGEEALLVVADLMTPKGKLEFGFL
ncbi:hypothetical protein DH86_00004325 [Scytalidium sp. 3C]|nr:hypothetical protein DH86_00004325 [Scytalidium sp. 3C]